MSGWVDASAWTDLKGAITSRILHVKGGTRQKVSGVKYKVVGLFQRDNQFIGLAVADVTEQVEFGISPGRWSKGATQGAPRIFRRKWTTFAMARRFARPRCSKAPRTFRSQKSITVIGAMFGLIGERRTPDMDEYTSWRRCKGTHPVQAGPGGTVACDSTP